MKAVFYFNINALFWAGMYVSAAVNPVCAADEQLSTPPAAKPLPGDSKKTDSDAKAEDAVRQDRIDKLIEQLGDKDYYVRQAAQNELARLSFDAFDALTAATTSDDLEIAYRAKYLLRLMRMEWTAKNDPPEVKKILKDYDRQSDEDRLAKMHLLAVMPEGKGILALCRLIRFEKSDELSKQAVIELLQSRCGAEPPKGPRAESIRKLFEKSGRASASWMLAWLKLADDPRSIAQWDDFIRAEISLLRRLPQKSSREIISALIRYQVAGLKKTGQAQEARTAMRRLIDLEDKGDLETLYYLLDWLVEQRAWNLIDELAARFAPRFESESMLLYILAQAQKEQGDAEKAERTAQRAFAINASRDEMNLLERLIPLDLMDIYRNAMDGPEELKLLNRNLIAERLSRRGLFDWAKREYEYIIARGRATDITTINAQWELSQMFHEQGRDLPAANVLESMLNKMDAKGNVAMSGRIASVLRQYYLFNKMPAEKNIDRTIAEVRARKYFLQACHWETAGDQAQRRECLKKALALEPEDIDVLIACYRMPDQTAEEHKKIMDLIHQAAEDIHAQITAQPDNAEYNNRYAWLVANTEGDLDEALKCSQKSLELSPDTGGLYDTLARVYYAKGDYENALKNQQRAVELDPHSGLIAKQLEFFKKARDEQKSRR